MKVKFWSDTSYQLFSDQADYRFPENFMEKNDGKLEIVFQRDVPTIMIEIGRDLGGVWTDD